MKILWANFRIIVHIRKPYNFADLFSLFTEKSHNGKQSYSMHRRSHTSQLVRHRSTHSRRDYAESHVRFNKSKVFLEVHFFHKQTSP